MYEEQQKRNATLTRMIANFLPAEWRYSAIDEKEGRYSGFYIVGDHGAKFYLHFRDARISISGCYPCSSSTHRGSLSYWGVLNNEQAPQMTVSAMRNPEDIAKDIKRRFLSEYYRLYLLCRDKKRQEIEKQNHLRVAFDSIKSVCGGDERGANTDPRNLKMYVGGYQSGYGSGELILSAYDFQTTLNFSYLPVDAAIRMMAVWNEEKLKYHKKTYQQKLDDYIRNNDLQGCYIFLRRHSLKELKEICLAVNFSILDSDKKSLYLRHIRMNLRELFKTENNMNEQTINTEQQSS